MNYAQNTIQTHPENINHYTLTKPFNSRIISFELYLETTIPTEYANITNIFSYILLLLAIITKMAKTTFSKLPINRLTTPHIEEDERIVVFMNKAKTTILRNLSIPMFFMTTRKTKKMYEVYNEMGKNTKGTIRKLNENTDNI